MTVDPALATEAFCYLTTTGRVTGRPHEIEIWFALHGDTAYLMAGDHGSDWVRNARKQPAVSLRIRDRTFGASARLVSDVAEDALVRRLLVEKYASPRDNLESWGRSALPVAIDLET
jgi:deazaflavin-dependent oxidoreductase (nitroreductase family)